MSPQAERNVRKPAPAPKKEAPPRPPRPRVPLLARIGGWRDQHFFSFFSSLGRLAARPWATALTVLVLGFALALPLLFLLVFQNARDLSGGMRAAREVTVFLQPGLDLASSDALAQRLRARADVADVLLRTPEQGLAEFRQLSGYTEALDALSENPLPGVLVITPAAMPVQPGEPALLAELRAEPGIDLVQYDAQWRHKLSGILDFGARVVAVVASLLALATLLVIGNTVRMDIQSRSEEISVMQLIGAGDGFVRRPFLYAGFWYGLLGSLLALALVLAVEFALAGPLARLLDGFGNRFAPRGVDLRIALVLVAASCLLGWLGAWVATARHLAAGRPRA
jgi:cell division transport system permease protein